MNLRLVTKLWNDFFFVEQSPTPIALFRIVFGLLVIESLTLMIPHLTDFYTDRGIVTRATMRVVAATPSFDLISLLPQNDFALWIFFAVVFAGAVMLTFGLYTRVAAVIVYAGLLSFHHRNTLVINSGDVLMHLMSFYLIFSPAGHAISFDRLRWIWQKPVVPTGPPERSSPWALRLMQLQLAAVYFQAFWTKVAGTSWLNGTALHYVLRETEYLRFPVPFALENLWITQLLTWGTLVIEGALWSLVWIREFRYPILLGGVMLHLGIDWSMSLAVFEWLMIACLILFVYPQDLTKVMNLVKSRVQKRIRARAHVVYHSENLNLQRSAETIRRLDIFGLVELQDAKDDRIMRKIPTAERDKARNEMLFLSHEKWLSGFRAFREIWLFLPLLWLWYPVIVVSRLIIR